MSKEWAFKTSRRGLLRFLGGATLIGGTAAVAKSVPDPAEGLVKLATPDEVPRYEGRYVPPLPQNAWLSNDYHFNVVPWRLYDTLTLDRMMGSIYYFFRNSLGPDTGLSITNMEMTCALPAPQHFQIHRMYMLLSGSRMDAESFAPPASLQLQIGHRIYSEVPVLDVCRYGLESVALKDEPGPRCMEFKPPLVIDPCCYFVAKLEGGGTWSGQLHAKLILDGLMAFGVQ